MIACTSNLFSGIIITLGVIIQQNVEVSYILKGNCAKSRKFLILKWMMIGVLLSNGYRSVLLATLVSPTFEKPIDTIQDLLDTERPIYAGGSIRKSFRYSSLESLKQLGTKIENTLNATRIRWRLDKKLVSKQYRNLKIIHFPFRENPAEVITILPTESHHTKAHYSYQGKELLFSWGQTFVLPKSSPLKVCLR